MGAVVGIAAVFQFGGYSGPVSTKTGLLKTTNAAMTEGNPRAPVKLVEYADFLCPYCSKFAQYVMPSIEKDYVRTGKVEVEFRPVAVITADSQRAAEGSYCAADQGKFWNYYRTAYGETWNDYYANNKKPEDVLSFRGNAINSLAQSAGLNVSNFSICVNSGKYATTVQQATDDFNKANFHGTPSFLINNVPYTGYAPYNMVQPVLNSYLKK